MGHSVIRVILVAALVAGGVGMSVVPARAQSGTASIGGRVTDPQGGLAVGATVTVTKAATALTRTTVTNNSGQYQIAALPPGTYTLTVTLAGFRTAKYDQLELRVDLPGRRDVGLTLGDLSEEIGRAHV